MTARVLLALGLGLGLGLGVGATGCGPDVVENGPKGPQIHRFAVLAAPRVKAPSMPMPGRPGPRQGDRRADARARAEKPPDFSEAVSAIATEPRLDFAVYLGPILDAPSPEDAAAAADEFKAVSAMISAPTYAALGVKDAEVQLPDLESALGLPEGKRHYRVSPKPGLHLIGLDLSRGPVEGPQLQWLEGELAKVPAGDRVVVVGADAVRAGSPAREALARVPAVKLTVDPAASPADGGKTWTDGSGLQTVSAPGLEDGRYLVITIDEDTGRVEVRPIREPAGPGTAAPAEPTIVPLRKAPKP